MSIKIEIWGDYACFTRPEMKVERVSYDILTPSAARGILEAIYWHPGMKWVIDEIRVISPIKFMTIKRNEVKSKINARKATATNGRFIAASADIDQRTSRILKDVHYIVEAHFEMTDKASEEDNPGKFQSIIKRRIQKGQNYHQPYFGTREFPVSYSLFDNRAIEVDEELKGEKDLGYMLYDLDYSDIESIQPIFFKAVMIDGVVDLRESEILK
ncbi:MAG: type I-C CRISPR-associated protein Cas5c [Erysipelotrichaceae bacterium]|nr:type I-C CRISPR-associated protein Cas5c [Erysipelotrichaceae bacterium]